AGGSLGAALGAWVQYANKERAGVPGKDMMKGGFLGSDLKKDQVRKELDALHARYIELNDDQLLQRVNEYLQDEKVIGWCQGRMEFGPRALGARSIIGDARSPKMQSVMNLKIKYRESFRPFAPIVLAEEVSSFFELDRPSPYMLI